MNPKYSPDWGSLRSKDTPKWFKDAKFGIYTHWGIYSVPAYGPNATWYPYNMYRPGTTQYNYHLKTYGGPEKFGYKDFIPDFTAARFDADEWAELFKKSGAQFAGPVGEHHDGFAMWDSQYTQWNATKMGPRRDVLGELEQAIRNQGMRFMVALHHAENWWFYPHWETAYDTADPQNSGLYGTPHNLDWVNGKPLTGGDLHDEWDHQDKPNKDFLDMWLGKTCEVIDRYQPDMLWFDFGLMRVQENYKKEMLAYYFNKEAEWGREVVLTYKWHHLVPGVGIIDLELGRFEALTYHDWITDTTVDDGHGWGYLRETEYKSVRSLIHYLIDNVSKNGNMLLNVGPKPNGEIPNEAREVLTGMGEWLDLNGEAIYGTTPWMIYGEGPTQMTKAGYFMEDQEVRYTADDIRFTSKNDVLYAICLGWSEQKVTIKSLARLYVAEIESVRMLGVHQELAWSLSMAGLEVQLPPQKPCDHAYVLKIKRTRPF
jgi:alpha-L-fucosidase